MDLSEQCQINLDNADFLAQKTILIDLIHDINVKIKERDHLKKNRTNNPIELIKIGNIINLKLEQIILVHDTFIQIYYKISKSKKLKKRYTEEQWNDFSNSVKILSTHVTECDAAVRHKTVTMNKQELSNLKMMDLDNEPEESMDEKDRVEAEEALNRWKLRDEQFDDQIRGIGEAVERIGDVALEIGGKSQAHAESAIKTAENVEVTTVGIGALSNQIKKIIKKQRKIECICRGILIAIFISLVFVLTLLIKKALRK